MVLVQLVNELFAELILRVRARLTGRSLSNVLLRDITIAIVQSLHAIDYHGHHHHPGGVGQGRDAIAAGAVARSGVRGSCGGLYPTTRFLRVRNTTRAHHKPVHHTRPLVLVVTYIDRDPLSL